MSGIPPTRLAGAGRLLIEIERQAAARGSGVRFLYGSRKSEVASALRRGRLDQAFPLALAHYRDRLRLRLALKDRALLTDPEVLLLHPQDLGFAWCERLIEARELPTWLYLLDSSFFCVRSYNYLPDEDEPCLRCLGGRFEEARAQGCQPFPKRDPEAFGFVRKLRDYVSSGKVRLLAQNTAQAELARKHFGLDKPPAVVGMWTVDIAEEMRAGSSARATGYDVVFHGTGHPAKGMDWAIGLARTCPELRFFFPVSRPHGARELANCDFMPMNWESGLREKVASSRITLVPSLWSAPVEGALVKSILTAPAVAVVRNGSSYAGELPEGLVLSLPDYLRTASEDLRKALGSGWRPDAAALAAWKSGFEQANRDLLDRIETAIQA